MIWPFKRRRLLDTDTENWHLDNFEWLVSCYAEQKCLAHARLVLPKPGFFQNDGEKGHALAERIFQQVKEYGQVADWETRLVPRDATPQSGHTLFDVQHGRSALGTYEMDERNTVTISYAKDLVEHPLRLIATLAHEIGHDLIARAPKRIICADDELEFLTDLAAIYMGFGVFLANTAFEFQQWRDDAIGTQGWNMKRQGYLPEPDLVFGLAIFLRSKAIDPDEARSCLKPHLRTMLDTALRDLSERSDDITRIVSLEA